jgi:hypothetical protein
MTLTAICRPHPGSQIPVLVDLHKADLGLRVDRIKNLIRMINLSSLMEPISAVIGIRTAEFLKLERLAILYDKHTATNINPFVIEMTRPLNCVVRPSKRPMMTLNAIRKSSSSTMFTGFLRRRMSLTLIAFACLMLILHMEQWHTLYREVWMSYPKTRAKFLML